MGLESSLAGRLAFKGVPLAGACFLGVFVGAFFLAADLLAVFRRARLGLRREGLIQKTSLRVSMIPRNIKSLSFPLLYLSFPRKRESILYFIW
jgi:hypothetical protein